MRRYLFLLIFGMLLIAPTACAKKQSAPAPQPFPPAAPTEPSYPQDNDDSYVPMNYYY